MVEKYFSEVLNKTFDTKEECLKAEAEFEKKHKAELELKEKRAADAKKVEELVKVAREANKEANTALSEFCKKYGSFHTSYTDADSKATTLFDVFFDNWF